MVGMRMAKADQRDLDAALELYQFLEAMRGGRPCPEVVEEFGYKGYQDLIKRDDAQDAEFVLRAHERGGLFRIAFGMRTLLDPRNEVVDPNVDYLAPHPKRDAEIESLRAQLAAVTAQRDELLHRARQTVWQGITCGKPYQLIPGEPLRAQLIVLGELCGAIEDARAQPEQPQQPPIQQPAVAEPSVAMSPVTTQSTR